MIPVVHEMPSGLGPLFRGLDVPGHPPVVVVRRGPSAAAAPVAASPAAAST